ncbi:UNVERIFIED_CONTAM: putative mitochondrial protein [Sesamum latifolium]|uniref:Mitochondrial protein n=1 Tax=Sesamum latifolium TaxID=2727402 RepID=A0AAW2WW89_9LAMI
MTVTNDVFIGWLGITCSSKLDGGLGFHNLEAFNLALLAKQLWRLLSRPDSLVSQVLKAKYFPRSHLLEARLGARPSYTWRSIWVALDLFRADCCWRIGTGHAVNIWQDPWIPRTPSFRIITPQPSNCPWMNVSNLLLTSTREWNEVVISALFWPEDRDYILQIPLSFSSVPDLLIWHYSPNGIFSVRSAYHLALSLDSPAGSSTGRWNSRVWRALWQAYIPNKAKVFMWRAIQNILPTASNLAKRLKSDSVVCPFCDFSAETPIHSLLYCSFARQVWALSGLRWSTLDSHDQSVEDWFAGLVLKLSPSDLHLVVMICWSLWWSRNLKLINKDYLLPLQGDGSGVIARDDSGSCVAWLSVRLKRGGNAELAEAFAAREPVRLARRYQWRHVIFEGDCSTLMQKFATIFPDFSMASPLIADVRSYCSLFETISFSLVLRSANSAADLLAKCALNQAGDFSCLPLDWVILFLET